MTRRRKPSFDPETIDPASVVKFQTIRRLGRTFEFDLYTPVPMADVVETGRDIALVRARRAGWPDDPANRLAERVAEYLTNALGEFQDNLEIEKRPNRAARQRVSVSDFEDEVPF